MALMAGMARLMSQGLTAQIAFNQLGGYRSRGKGRQSTFPPSNGSARVRREARHRRNVLRHRAHCRS